MVVGTALSLLPLKSSSSSCSSRASLLQEVKVEVCQTAARCDLDISLYSGVIGAQSSATRVQ